jgi:riboflavin synthase
VWDFRLHLFCQCKLVRAWGLEPQRISAREPKGSITIDGISLTVATVEPDRFSVSLIPHTAAVTVLGRKRPGDIVNLETDIIGKYVEKLLRPAQEPRTQSTITLDFLTKNGF